MASNTAFAGLVPANYDKYLGPVLFEPYALDLYERMIEDNAGDILEIACGTGRLTSYLVKMTKGKARITATDLNADMIEHAKTLVKSDKVEWIVADAQDLPFREGSFDHIVCQYGVMFFPDKLKAFKEVFRVLKDNGRFLFNTWHNLEHNPRINCMKEAMDEIFGEEAPDFYQKGPYSFFNPKEIKKLLSEAGFGNIQVELVKKTAHYEKTDQLVKGFLDGSPLGGYLKTKKPEVQQQVRNRIEEKLKEQEKEFGNKVPMQAYVCEAIK
jgi:ubiquinone/menaquinone biosynthesis C-methylase UbiE